MSASNTDKNQLVLGYWAIRGLVEPIQLALHYAKHPYTEKMYEQGEAPAYSREEWLSEKQRLGLDFPNLPYMIEGDMKMTQSKAILYYLGRKLNLMGKTPAEEAQVMMLCEEAHDFRERLSGVCYGPDGGSKDERKKFAQGNLSDFLKQMDAYLGKHNTKFAVGDQPTVADFQLYEYIDAGLLMDEEHTIIDKFSNVKRFMKSVKELPEVGEYMVKAHAQLPINNKIAKFGGKVLERK